jgi:hypothetical protein
MKDPKARIRMLDGFNEGWIEFERGEARSTRAKSPWKRYCGIDRRHGVTDARRAEARAAS